MSPRFVLGRKNVPCVAEVVNRSLKADCTDFTFTVARASAETTPSLYYQSLIDFTLAVVLIGSL